jgi:hypothetical protein
LLKAHVSMESADVLRQMEHSMIVHIRACDSDSKTQAAQVLIASS